MFKFQITGVDAKAGRERFAKIAAENETEASAKAKNAGILPTKIVPIGNVVESEGVPEEAGPFEYRCANCRRTSP